MEVLRWILCGSLTTCCLLVVSVLPLFVEANVQEKEVVCNSIDIRNSVRNFKKLENCTVIEGFLQITLIDQAVAADYENISFPALREITEYLLLYRANGLTSVGKLFPNLVVIRGVNLAHNFALVIFEMSSLQEIGLHSLTDILRGHAKIEKNMDLCYVETIEWGRITHAGPEGNYISKNRDRNQCPDTCKPSCDKHSPCGEGVIPWIGDRSNCLLCWGPHKCQKVCSKCGTGGRELPCFGPEKNCCAKECLGGCTGPKASQCWACRNFVYEGQCLEACPKGTYEFSGRRCITEDVCKNITKKKPGRNETIYFKPFGKECSDVCPPGYTEKIGDNHSCVECKKCPKLCPTSLVDSVSAAQRLKGCTTITGSLEIQIQGGSNIIQELEENLKDIQEIKGFLKIVRSPPLVSFSFLKNLRYIRGEILDRNNEYALLVLDNPNLQDIWDWKSRNTTLEIPNGKVFFHSNGKLCVDKIRALNSSCCKVNDWDDRDVSPTSNGEKVPCDVHTLEARVMERGSDVAVIAWKSFQVTDYRQLLSYVVYYKKAETQNVTIFDGRDACSSDVWTVYDVEPSNRKTTEEKHILHHLQPFTQYAYYVKAYMTASADKGAQSQIQYFKTNASTPGLPIQLKAQSDHPHGLIVTWKEPKRPNGIIANYTVVVTEKPDLPEIVFQRNYCEEDRKPHKGDIGRQNLSQPSSSGGYVTTSISDIGSSELSGKCCSCDGKAKPSLDKKSEEAEQHIQFEDFIQNLIFVRNPYYVTSENSRTRRHVASGNSDKASQEHSDFPESSTTEVPISTDAPPTQENNQAPHPIIKNVSGGVTFLKVESLKHFTEYAIEVKACQAVNPSFRELGCSLNAITTVRTQPLGGADDIPDESLNAVKENNTLGSIFIKWDEPKSPNGLIVSYQIEYTDTSRRSVCISSLDYKEHRGHRLVKLNPGNYSFRVRATSLASNGNWTQSQFFIIPAIPNDKSLEMLWIIIPIILLVLCVFPVGGYYFFKRRFGMRVPDGILYASVNPEYMSAGLVYEPDEWEIPREKIAMLRELGQGSFGMVYEGEAKDIQGHDSIKCAVKTVNESASVRERIEFLQEASVMKAFKCHHVVQLLGVVSKGHPTLVVMELMAKGDLKSYLRSHRPDEVENMGCQPPSLKQIFQMAIEIADGMAYLAAKKFVHRDLAARNCMVAEDLTVKIGDFGMTRDIYETDYYRKGGKGLLPVRWMAPESLKDGIFTSQSDVWSYGVVLWEMATLASQPYQGLSNEQVLKYVINGGMMEKPENCPEKLYALMKMCWHKLPRSRPTFSELIEVLLPNVGGNFHDVSFYFTERPRMLAAKEEEPSIEVVTSSTPLKSPSALDCASVNSRDNSDDDLDGIQYFPISSSAFTNGSDIVQCVNGIHSMEEGSSTAQLDLNLGGNGKRHAYSNNEGSKGMSLPSSDGSKGSKVSSVSNGSLANGHAAVPFPSARTTTC